MNENKEMNIDFKTLVAENEVFQNFKNELIVSIKLSLTGIVNLVTNYEDPRIVKNFISKYFKKKQLYYNTIDIDAVELQHGNAGQMKAYQRLDELIYGTIKTNLDSDLGIPIQEIDPQTGKRKRNLDGFVYRVELSDQNCIDKILIINNIDHCLDFCEKTGEIESKSLDIFDKFRDVAVNQGCKMLLITNEKLKFPFQVKTLSLPFVNEYSAKNILYSFIKIYRNASYNINFTNNQESQIFRKLYGLTYTEAGDCLSSAISLSKSKHQEKTIDSLAVTKNLRKSINKKFMDKGFGLTQLTSKPWEDYICPETSSFTWDVKKLLRDFNEIKRLNKIVKKCIKQNKDETKYHNTIQKIKNRIPHVILLYGKGGTGKSAFPVHFAGLLNFDIWDFNINALHDKYIGESSKQTRKSIESIMNTTHSVIRIDEYDRAMGTGNEGGNDMHPAHKQVESEFMSWLQNGQEENEFVKKNIFVILTTNHKENITGPMLRSGRVDLAISIDNFDSKSVKETLKTTARRMKNREIDVLGFDSSEELQENINKLDLDRISELCTSKGFTVRDIEMLIIEMAAYKYYKDIEMDEEGLEWNTENFCKVLENSQGSMRENDSTGELILGDRDIFQKTQDKKQQLDFFEDDKGFSNLN